MNIAYGTYGHCEFCFRLSFPVLNIFVVSCEISLTSFNKRYSKRNLLQL